MKELQDYSDHIGPKINRRQLLALSAAGAVAGLATPALARQAGELSRHRIDGVEFRQVDLRWPRLVGKNARLDVHGRGPERMTVCVVKTDQGATGWGEMQGNRRDAERAFEQVRGKPVSDLINPAEGITSNDWRVLDIPLHDLAGKLLGIPVWKMLDEGRETPFVTKIYSGMIYFDELQPIEHSWEPKGIDKVLENCQWDYDHGYRQFKVKIGRGNIWMEPEAGLQRDIEVVKAIAAAFPDVEILVDGNDGFTADGFIRFLEGIAPIPLFWIEEPFRETLADWRKLAQWTRANGYEKTYLADGEAAPDFEILEPLEAEGTLTLRLTDIVGAGFTRWREWMPELKQQNVAVSPHTWGSGLKTVYTAHLVGGLGNAPTVEGVTCNDADVDFGENRIVDGQFQPSSEPGFGLRLR